MDPLIGFVQKETLLPSRISASEPLRKQIWKRNLHPRGNI